MVLKQRMITPSSVYMRIFFFKGRHRVVDPYSFFTDPDPELDVGGQYGSGSNTDPGL